MKFSVRSKTLLNHLSAVGKAINSKPYISIFGTFHLNLSAERLEITASDTEHIVTTHLTPDTIESVGSVCIESKRLLDIVKALPDCSVTIGVDNAHNVTITHPNGHFSMPGIASEEYPKFDAMKDEDILANFVMEAHQITTSLDNVSFAASTDAIRPIMTGVLWDIKEDSIVFVASDTCLLAKYRNTSVATNTPCSFVMPIKATTLLRALIAKAKQISITVSNKQVVFKSDAFILRCKTINGSFPAYDRVIPQNNNRVASLSGVGLSNVVNRVSLCTNSASSLMKMRFNASDIEVSAQDVDFNLLGSEKLSCEYNAPDMEIGINAFKLKAILSAMTTQNIIIRLSEPSRPILFLPSENEEHGELTILCMPLAIVN